MNKLHAIYDVVITVACVSFFIRSLALSYYVETADEIIKANEDLIETYQAYLDTCHQRNDRLFDKLFEMQKERIIKLNNESK